MMTVVVVVVVVLVVDVFEKKCCHVDCYTLVDCKHMISDECTSAPVECAMGQFPLSSSYLLLSVAD